MKKIIALILIAMMAFALAACQQAPAPAAPEAETATTPEEVVAAAEEAVPAEEGKQRSIGFVMMSLNGEFFAALADAFVKGFTEAGWDASVADANFDVPTQIEAVENYIAMEKDVIVLWAINGPALSAVAQQVMDAGIKYISFVTVTDKYDACMVSDNAVLASDCCMLAAKWVNETFPDAAPGSIPCALLSLRVNDTNTEQADEMLKIAEYCPALNLVREYEVTEETTEAGLKAAEDLYMTNPEIQVFLSPHAQVALGVNNYFTSLSSPVTDYSKMGIFTVNGASEVVAAIKASTTNEAPYRGTVITAGVETTVADLLFCANGLLDGSLQVPYTSLAKNELVIGSTVDEYIANGTVTSFTEADLKK